jgi:hypothetical protein
MRRVSLVLVGVVVSAVAFIVPAPPASATIHEIVASWCSGKGPLEPPGIQDGKNFAQPVVANGFVGGTVPFDGPEGPGLLIQFNFGIAPAKVIGTGVYVVIGTTPAGPLYVQLIEPDPTFPAFQRCPGLAG